MIIMEYLMFVLTIISIKYPYDNVNNHNNLQ